jgi:hypothetical protein
MKTTTLLSLLVRSALVGMLIFLSACSVMLVQPYDEKLLTDTESLFKKASAMVDDGQHLSPKTDDERRKLKGAALQPKDARPLASHPAHVTQFAKRYNELQTDADALILRALSKSHETSQIGEKLQLKIEKLIEESIPSNCPENDGVFLNLTASLTVKNYIDLKCILVKWKDQHSDLKLTEDTEILKRSNWELRRSTLFAAILAIQSAETAKKK